MRWGDPEGRLHVVFVSDRLAFPNGMAATNRVRLLARALVEQGVKVKVLTLHVTELPPVVENRDVRGQAYGIEFEYACGTTTRADSFIERRRREIQGWIVGGALLLRLRRHGMLDCVYLYWPTHYWTPHYWVVVRFLRALRVPIIRELNERPWNMRRSPTWMEERESPIRGMAGVVTISGFLADWARQQSQPSRRDLEVLEIPILADVDEQRPDAGRAGAPFVVYAASSQYPVATRFVMEAMHRVWETHTECGLVITGTNPNDPDAAWLLKEARQLDERISLPGHLPRQQLLDLYAGAAALLAPLFDDIGSRARFPTKIGEYLASGRPVVSNAVGEVERIFTDGEDAYIALPGDACAFGDKIVEALVDPQEATRVGLAGRDLARRRFHYAAHGPALLGLIETVVRRARNGHV